jgi:hypothetical protein
MEDSTANVEIGHRDEANVANAVCFHREALKAMAQALLVVMHVAHLGGNGDALAVAGANLPKNLQSFHCVTSQTLSHHECRNHHSSSTLHTHSVIWFGSSVGEPLGVSALLPSLQVHRCTAARISPFQLCNVRQPHSSDPWLKNRACPPHMHELRQEVPGNER